MGGAIIATHSNIMISKSTFEDNIAEQGGAIYSEEGSTFTIMNSTFVDNHALCQRRMTGRCNGGTIYAEGSTINSTITTSMATVLTGMEELCGHTGAPQ